MTDRYRVDVTARASREIDRLPPRIAPAVIEFITRVLPGNPQRLSKPLTADLEGSRSARRGDYRVLFHIDEERSTIVITRVAHRAQVYRP